MAEPFVAESHHSSIANMGSAQSSQREEPHQRLLETLRAMDNCKINEQKELSEKDYVVVVQNKPSSQSSRSPASQDVSIASTQQWEKELLQDPKVRLGFAMYEQH